VLLVTPTGSAPSPWWRRFGVASQLALVAAIMVILTTPGG
jgi:hypothetical protein